MVHRVRWNDLQIVLAVAEHGSASQAAGLLGINHSTVIRRVNNFEATHAVKLFERHPAGLRPTRAGLALLAASRPIEGALLNIEREILGQDLKLEGLIRLTTTDSIAYQILAPHLKTFRDAHPAISLDLIATNTRLDLPRLDADLSVRPSRNPPDDLVGRNVSGMAFTIYACVDAYGAWQRLPPDQRPWVGISHDLKNSPVAKWMQLIEDNGQVTTRGNSFVATRELAAMGCGLTVLPCFLGDCDSRLVRVEKPIDDLASNLWVLTHKDLRNSARVRALSDHLAHCLRRQRSLLEGRPYERSTPLDDGKKRCRSPSPAPSRASENSSRRSN